MNTTSLPPARLKHPALLVFLLGGLVGAGINLALTSLLHLGLGWPPLLAIFLGTLANQLWHFLYYAVVFVQEEVYWRLGPLGRGVVYVLVAAVSACLLEFFLMLGFDFLAAVLAVLLVLSLVNALLLRIVSFSSARLAAIEYQAMDADYYDEHTQTGKVGWFRAWFHRSRFDRLTQFVDAHYQPGMRIADLGCGNCWWNRHSLPVTGVDINEKMLGWAVAHGRLRDYQLRADLTQTGLPAAQFDIVVMSETLEHLLQLPEVLAEVRRLLKPQGIFLVTVPYDFMLSPFFVLFNLHCVYQGFLKGSLYHRYRCGHINHFTRKRLRQLLKENGFQMKQMFIVNGLTLYASAQRQDHG